jgi:hypothetical protein
VERILFVRALVSVRIKAALVGDVTQSDEVGLFLLAFG